jgi:hypothetical protein
MSAKKKRRKIVVNTNQKTGHCGPDCEKNKFRQLGAPKEVFVNRLRTPTLVDLSPVHSPGFSAPGQECCFEVYASGLCHPTSFGTDSRFGLPHSRIFNSF